MMNKKGSSWWTWFWIILFIAIITSAVRHSYYRQAMYNDITGKITDNYNEELQSQQMKEEQQRQYEQEQYENTLREQQQEEAQRQYEQEQYEEMLRERQRQEYEEQLRQQQSDGYYQQQSKPQTTTIKCTDSDGGKDFYIKGYVTRGDGINEYDECSTGAYKDYVWEYYCTTSGTGSLNYKCLYGCSDGACNLEPQTTTITVLYVFDGDTLKLSSGEGVRLVGLNAPELGQSCSSEATNKLKEFVLGKEVILEQDIDTKDRYGRLLRYVYVGDTFVNLEMVRLGLAHKYEYGSNTKYSSQFEQAENDAKQNEGCLWKSEEINYIQDQCIYI